jgi:tyrosine-protein phosphatase SIW14
MKFFATSLLPLLLTLAPVMRATEPPPAARVRPAEWAQPVIGAKLENFFRVSDGVFRSEQPELADLPALQALGIRAVLSLRDHHEDPKKFAAAGLALLRHEASAGSLTETDLIAGLRLMRDAPKPVLVHCWHGSDRTGAVVAAWRMVFQGWTKDQAVDELVNGGYGFHAKTFPDIVPLLRSLDVEKLRAQLAPPTAKAPLP